MEWVSPNQGAYAVPEAVKEGLQASKKAGTSSPLDDEIPQLSSSKGKAKAKIHTLVCLPFLTDAQFALILWSLDFDSTNSQQPLSAYRSESSMILDDRFQGNRSTQRYFKCSLVKSGLASGSHIC